MMMMTIGITFVSKKNITIQFTIKSSSLSMNGKTMIVCVWGGLMVVSHSFYSTEKKTRKKEKIHVLLIFI